MVALDADADIIAEADRLLAEARLAEARAEQRKASERAEFDRDFPKTGTSALVAVEAEDTEQAHKQPAGAHFVARGSNEPPEDLIPFLERDVALMQLWCGIKPSGNKSTSAKDAALAARLYRAGAPESLICAALMAYGHGQISKVTDQVADRRIARLLAFVAKPMDADERHDLSHDGLALEMGGQWRDIARHVALWGRWLFWDRQRWEPDEKLLHMTDTRTFLRQKGEELVVWAETLVELATKSGSKDAIKKAEAALAWARDKATTLRSAPMVAHVVGLARSNAEMVASVAQWDADPLALGAAMTVDLHTGVLRQPRPEDYITKLAAIVPAPQGTPAPLWTAFLARITGKDAELQSYLQRVAGYCITASVREHALFFAYGTGANGKSVFVNTLVGIMADYAMTISTDMLMVSQTDRHPTEIARLRGARLAVGNEIESGKTWAESKIKSLTGGDRLQGRFMRQDFFEFDPQFKLIIIGNNKPSLRGVDEAIRRRLHLIPFTVTIPPAERDLQLADRLQAEWPAILRWAIDGCLEWQRQGLNPPDCVCKATTSYLDAEDTFEQWRDDCTQKDNNAWESSADLWASWKKWAEAAGEFVGTKRKFVSKLEDHGLVPAREASKAQTRGYRGARINRPDHSEDPRYGN